MPFTLIEEEKPKSRFTLIEDEPKSSKFTLIEEPPAEKNAFQKILESDFSKSF